MRTLTPLAAEEMNRLSNLILNRPDSSRVILRVDVVKRLLLMISVTYTEQKTVPPEDTTTTEQTDDTTGQESAE